MGSLFHFDQIKHRLGKDVRINQLVVLPKKKRKGTIYEFKETGFEGSEVCPLLRLTV